MKTCDLGNGQTLSYTDSSEGPVLVLLHAFPLDRQMWQPQIGPLSTKARVLALDLPGFGGSSPTPFTVDSAADQVAALLKKLGITSRVVVAGLSMGGYVAMAFARRHPDQLAGLILADTKSEADDEKAREGREKTIALTREAGVQGVIEQLLPKLLCEHTITSRPQVVDEVRRIAAGQSTEAVVNALAALRDRPDATPGLENISATTLVLVGEHDVITPPLAASAIGAKVWGSEVVAIPSAGHLSNLENPDAFNAAVLEFVTKVHQA